MTAATSFRRSAIPFLVLAEPIAFFLYQGGTYCEPLCVRPTVTGLGTLGLVLLGTWGVAAVLTWSASRAFRLDRPLLIRFTNPRRATLALLFGLFGAFLFFLTLDATSVPGVFWKLVVLPLSLGPFLPVWALYAATFPLALITGILGIEFSQSATLLLRGIVLFGGFGLAALWQAIGATVIVEAIASR